MHRSRPTPLESHLGYWIRVVSNAVSQNFARKVQAEGVTVAEWAVLRILFDSQPLAPSLLAERMGMTKGAISKLAERLVEKKLVIQTANANDRRGLILKLSKAALAIVPRLAALADQNDAEFFGSLAPKERQLIEATFRAIVSKRQLKSVPTD